MIVKTKVFDQHLPDLV